MIVRQVFKSANVTLGGQAPVLLDYLKIPFSVSLNVDIVSGTSEYDIQYTTDDLVKISSDEARWHTVTSGASSLLSAFVVPVTALRIFFTVITGEVRVTTIQGTNGG